MSAFRTVPAAVLLSVFLIAPAIAGAVEALHPGADVAPPVVLDDAAPPVVADEGAPPVVVGEEAAPATPQAAIDWNNMEAARRAARDRALQLRQQTIQQENQAQPVR